MSDVIASDRPEELTLTNWDLGGPVSEWSYRHTGNLFATKRLAPGFVAAEDGTDVTVLTSAELADELHTGLVSSVTIQSGGRTVFRWPDGSHGRHLLMSVSKVFASLAIGILNEQHELDYSRPVRAYLPELGAQWQPCLLQHVLDMTSGVDCPEVGDPRAYRDPAHPFYQFEASLGLRPATRPESPYDLVLGYGRSGTPGSRYAYTSVNTFILAWIIERVTGVSYPEALQDLLWDNLALSTDSAICVSDAGVAFAHGGVLMSTDDLARFGTVFTPSSPPVQHALKVPDSYLAMLRGPSSTRALVKQNWPGGAHPAGQWNLVYPDGDMFKSGFGGQGLFVSPVSDVVIAFAGVPDDQGHVNSLARLCRDLVQQVIVPR